MMDNQRVVVGGGYAGVMAANRLTQRDDLTVTLINPRPDFVHRIRLHQLVGGTGAGVVGYRDVLAGRVELVVADERLTSIDDDRIVAAGDSAAPSNLPLRMSCQAADPLGAHAADTVLARIAGRQPAPIAIGFRNPEKLTRAGSATPLTLR